MLRYSFYDIIIRVSYHSTTYVCSDFSLKRKRSKANITWIFNYTMVNRNKSKLYLIKMYAIRS